jgi:hypothetical protein
LVVKVCAFCFEAYHSSTPKFALQAEVYGGGDLLILPCVADRSLIQGNTAERREGLFTRLNCLIEHCTAADLTTNLLSSLSTVPPLSKISKDYVRVLTCLKMFVCSSTSLIIVL